MDTCHIKLCLPSYKVCSSHFHADQFERNGYLKKYAIPICFSEISTTKLDDCTSTSSNSIKSSKSYNAQSPNIGSNNVTVLSAPNVEPINVTVLDEHSTQKNKRKLFNPITIGDLEVSHFSTPEKARRHLDMVKNKYKQKQIQNCNLKKQIKRLQKKLASYKDLVKILQRNNLLSENALKNLQVYLI